MRQSKPLESADFLPLGWKSRRILLGRPSTKQMDGPVFFWHAPKTRRDVNSTDGEAAGRTAMLVPQDENAGLGVC